MAFSKYVSIVLAHALRASHWVHHWDVIELRANVLKNQFALSHGSYWQKENIFELPWPHLHLLEDKFVAKIEHVLIVVLINRDVLKCFEVEISMHAKQFKWDSLGHLDSL